MSRQDLITVLTSRPFKPFRMHVSEGAIYSIWHPDLVLVSTTSAVVGVAEGDRPGPAIETFRIVDLAHIVRLEEIEPADTAEAGSKS